MRNLIGSIKNDEGFYNRSFYGEPLSNPLEAIEDGKNNNSRSRRWIATGTSTINFTRDLNLKTMFTLDANNGHSTRFTPPKHGSDRSKAR